MNLKSTLVRFSVFWMTLFPAFCRGSKILLISPPLYSLCAEVSVIGQELLDRGHQVSIFLPDYFQGHHCYNRSINSKHIQLIEYKTNGQAENLANAVKSISVSLEKTSQPTVFESVNVFTTVAHYYCEGIFADKRALERIHDEKFAYVIFTGQPAHYCFVAIPYKLAIPYSTVGSYYEDIIWGKPFLPSISPDAFTVYTGDMNFAQRVRNTAVQLYARLRYRLSFPIHTLSDFAPELSVADIEHLVSQSDLFLLNTDPVLGYSLPVMPNHILVGGLTTRPVERDLPNELREFYDQAADGVIIVSFGSIFSGLPNRIEEVLMGTLQRLGTKVLWKYRENKVIGNVKQVTWFPQNDLLGNSKTRLIVSHCGNNGLFEALYHGIPVVCTPLFMDQFFNAARAESWEVGKQINLREASGEEIFKVITETLKNSTIRANMAQASEIYRSQPMNAREKAAFWVEHVIRYGSNHLKSRAASMSVFSVLGFDVLCLLIASTIVLVLLLFCLLRICFRNIVSVKNVKLKDN